MTLPRALGTQRFKERNNDEKKDHLQNVNKNQGPINTIVNHNDKINNIENGRPEFGPKEFSSRTFGPGQISGDFSNQAESHIGISVRSGKSPEIRIEIKQIHCINYYEKHSAEQSALVHICDDF